MEDEKKDINWNEIIKKFSAHKGRITDLRKSIDGLILDVETHLKLDPFAKALFVFCNRQMNRIKILHFDEGFWLYYYRLENNKLKWPMTKKKLKK